MLPTDMESRDVVVIEDNLEMRGLYKEFFAEERDYQVEIVNNASDGARKLANKGFNLIILDMIMEKVSGENFCEFLREQEDFSQIPILLISVVESQKLQEMSEKYGASFLQKPITKDALMEKLSKVI